MMQVARTLRSRVASRGKGRQPAKEKTTETSSRRRIFADVSNRKSTTDGQEPLTKLKREPAAKVEATAYRSSVGVLAKKNTVESVKAPDRRRSLRSAVKGMDKISVADDSKALVPKTRMGAKKPTTKSQAIAVVAKKRKPCAAIAAKKVAQTVKRGRSSVKEQEEPPRKRTRRSTKSGMETLVVGKKAEVVKKVGPVPTASRPKKRATTDSGTDGKPSQIEPRELCTDFLAETDYCMVRKPFDNTKYTFGLSLHDEKHKDNVLMVADYVTDMFQRLYHAEVENQPSDYMRMQEHINPMMRSILVDWLVEVHMKFRLTAETLYLCVNIIDRYSCHAAIDRKKLQLVGVTALLLACKYEEIYPPEVRDCVYITDKAYTRQQVIDMEQDIVKHLQFKLTVPTGYPFLTRFLTIIDASESIKQTAHYYMERTLQDYVFVHCRQSLVAAAAVCLALNNVDARRVDNISGSKPGVPKILLEYTGFTKAQVFEVAEKIVDRVGEEIVTASARELVAVKRKYEGRKFGAVAGFINPEFRDLL